MTMKLYDTRRQELVAFEPGPVVSMYTCGITPYDAAHLGHAATYLTYDVLQRRLRDLGHQTECVRNVTDIDDPLFERAKRDGVDWKDLGDRELASFQENMDALNLLPSFSEPRATEGIEAIHSLITVLFDKGHAYEVNGTVYFAISTWSKFGHISNLSRDEMLVFAAERGGNPDDPQKRDALDFVLWQPSAEDEPSWPSPWGAGRPGWHIECSALAMRDLHASTIDLHGGGDDLIFPHHECEAAQSEAATGEPFSRLWMHVAMVSMDGEKMSKSLGNLVFVRDLVREWDPSAVRLAVLSHHYRVAWEWNDSLMPNATSRLQNWRAAGEGEGALEAVRAVLDADLDTPAALELIDEAAARGNGVSAAAELLGVVL